MRCNTLLCAQAVIIDKTSNLPSIINIYEGMQSTLYPFQMPISIFISTEKEVEDPQALIINLKVELETQVLLEIPISIAFTDASLKNNTTVNLQGLLINRPGNLFVIVSYNQIEIGKRILTFEQKPQ